METQVILTGLFNAICIGYATLTAANFVCGLVEVWMSPKSDESGTTDTPVSEQQVVNELPQPEVEMVREVEQVDVWEEAQEELPVEHTECNRTQRDHEHLEEQVMQLEVTKADELQGLTIRELKAMCKGGRVKGYGKMTKAQLVKALIAIAV
jgi:hypothetical protein